MSRLNAFRFTVSFGAVESARRTNSGPWHYSVYPAMMRAQWPGDGRFEVAAALSSPGQDGATTLKTREQDLGLTARMSAGFCWRSF